MIRTRQNVYSLDASERRDLIAAFHGLKRNGVYDDFVRLHAKAMAIATPWMSEVPNTGDRNGAHRGPVFLPWHREYLRRLELEMQKIVPGIMLPYWDWAADAALEDPRTAEIWGEDLMGGDGDPANGYIIADGPYTEADWPIPADLEGPAIRRRMGVFEVLDDDTGTIQSQALELSGQDEVDAALALQQYDSPNWNRQADGFRRALEGWNDAGPGQLTGSRMHNIVHLWTGGMWVEDDNGTLRQRRGSMVPATSPNDPVFFLNHCFVDKLWADWQDRREAEAPAEYPHYQPITDGPIGHRFFDNMYFPGGVSASPANVNNFRALGYEYEQPATESVVSFQKDRNAYDK